MDTALWSLARAAVKDDTDADNPVFVDSDGMYCDDYERSITAVNGAPFALLYLMGHMVAIVGQRPPCKHHSHMFCLCCGKPFCLINLQPKYLCRSL